jgi:exonuclease III
MKILSWNCQGLGNPQVRAFQKLITTNHPDILFLMETKLAGIPNKLKDKFAASYSYFNVDCSTKGTKGKSGGLMLLWNNCTCLVNIMDMDFNYIDFLVTNISNSTQWRTTGVYGYLNHHKKHLTCDLIKTFLSNSFNNKWLLLGDFNLILSNEEKYGG